MMNRIQKSLIALGAAAALALVSSTPANAVTVGGYDPQLGQGDLEWRLDWDVQGGLEWMVTNRDTVPHQYFLKYVEENGQRSQTGVFTIEPGGRHEVANDRYVIGNKITPKATLHTVAGKRIDDESIAELR